MTEKEIFLNMLKRVCGYESGDSYFYWEERGDTVVITNENDEITNFIFNNKGELIWYY